MSDEIKWRSEVKAILQDTSADLKFDEPLSAHTSFRIGGRADVFILVNNEEELRRVLRFCEEHHLKLFLIGQGTNVLISDQGLRGVVVKLAGDFSRIEVRGEVVEAGAGAKLDRIAEVAEMHGRTGLGFLAGIPGTVGGGLLTNAGAFGHSLAEQLEQVRVMDRGGNVKVLTKQELKNEYRRPVIPDDVVALSVNFRLRSGEVAEGVQKVRAQRRAKHPGEPSAGSFFKNPGTEPAGKLVERCGLKGLTVGDAKVSEKHANFIVNTGRARFVDVYELAQIVKATVEEMTGIELEEEVCVLSSFLEEATPTSAGAGTCVPERGRTGERR